MTAHDGRKPAVILDEVTRFLQSLDQDDRHGPATLFYNESWLLRLVLAAEARGIRCLPQPFEPGANWFTEALLYTPFPARRRGDTLAESVTHADGVIGHFVIGRSSRAGLHLLSDATQFVITEAKMFSGLSKGTTHAPDYDQAARNVACLAHAVSRAERPLDSYRSLGFWVLAPDAQIRANVFACVACQSIEERIRHRVLQYDVPVRNGNERLKHWFANWVVPLVGRLHLACVSWEQVIADVKHNHPEYGADLQEFYDRCLRFNGPVVPNSAKQREV